MMYADWIDIVNISCVKVESKVNSLGSYYYILFYVPTYANILSMQFFRPDGSKWAIQRTI